MLCQFGRSLQNTLVHGALATVAATAAAISEAPSVQAAALRLGPLVFSEAGGDFVLTNGQVEADRFVLEQEVYGPNINLFIAIDGLRSACPNRGGCYFTVLSLVTNRTGSPWIFFDHELQEIYGVQSPEADGLSFAQGINQVRPFNSDRYARVDEVTDVRDFVNFSSGVVAPGERVAFRYVIADTTPINRFYLLQRPNFQAGGVGFVEPPPPVVIPDPVIPIPELPNPIVPPVEPVVEVVPPPVIDPGNSGLGNEPPPAQSSGEPNNSAAVPEPATILGVLVFGAIAGGARLKHSR
ncbi:MAG: hypothetical protein IGS48_02785 [Oscillatoriales cyanobacterium C42_A2020_001]|nr:hypothetical protein [Leptolyngbyaceae cyanobacterium C42_A2020_001]